MVWHETVCPDITPGICFCDRDIFEIRLVVFCIEEGSLAPITTLGDMMWVTGKTNLGMRGIYESQSEYCIIFSYWMRSVVVAKTAFDVGRY
jgi:hypothetical protein